MKNFFWFLIVVCLIHCLTASIKQDIKKTIITGHPYPGPVPESSYATPGQFPWQVILKEDELDDLLCGGSIISPSWVLTAAHCCAGRSSVYMRFGTIELENDNDYSLTSTEMHIHPNYDNKTYNNDVCLVKLPSELPFSRLISPIKLVRSSQASDSFVGSIADIAGFGIMSDEYLDPSENLLWAQIKIIEHRECADVFKDGLIIDSTICGKGYGIANMSICNGDSGGAMVTSDKNGNPMQIGINSFVSLDQCTVGHPSAYVRITSFLSYIYNITGLPQYYE